MAADCNSSDLTWRDFSGEQRDFPIILENAKQRVIDTILASEFGVLCGALSRIAAGHFSTRDFTIDRLRAALRLYVLEFPVYRTYVTAAGTPDRDRKLIGDVISRARARWEGPDPQIFDFLHDAVTLDLAGNAGYSAPRVRDFASEASAVHRSADGKVDGRHGLLSFRAAACAQ